MRDIGGLVWIVFVLFAVISSIVKSARRARAVPASQNPQVNRAAGTPARTQVIAQFHQQAQPVAQPRPVAQPPPAAPQPVPPPPPPQAAPRVAVAPKAQARAPATGRFADRDALIRGIVAAEVLGKPLALRDE